MKNTILKFSLTALAALTLAACGSSGGSGDSANDNGQNQINSTTPSNNTPVQSSSNRTGAALVVTGEDKNVNVKRVNLTDYNLETLFSAVIERMNADMINIDIRDIPEIKDMMDEIVEDSYKTYRKLVFEDPNFYNYFFEATPIKEVSSLNIGSRPASRKKITDIGGLRAIPWVFSWSQSRIMLPGWYGVGTAFSNFINKDSRNVDKLRTMYKDWPFFTSLLSNVDMVMSKSDMEIAKEYANLCKDDKTKEVYNKILREWKLTKQVVLDISEHKEFLEDNTYLTKSLENRLQYFNTLNLLQIELIRRAREEETLESQINTIHITINGVATGLRNSG